MSMTNKAAPAGKTRPTDTRLNPVVSHIADRLEAAGARGKASWDEETLFTYISGGGGVLSVGEFYGYVVEVCGHLAQSLTFDLPADVRTRHEKALSYAQDPRNLRALHDACALEIERRAKVAKAAAAA